MSQAIVTFDIIEYLPSDFKFDNFSFIISSESRDFEQEISYLNKNQITHRASLNKRELKYSIKTTKNSSLIGISDLIIPSSIISKRENVYDKTCSIAMSDSVKRVLFGNTSPSNFIKINLHITLQYKEKEKNVNKANEKKEKEKDSKHLSNSGKKVKSYERSESFGKGGDHKKESGHAANTFSQRNFGVYKKNEITRKQRSNSKPTSNIKSSQTVKPKTQIFNNSNKLKEVQKAILEDEHNEGEKKNKNKNKNESFVDDELNREIKEINPQFVNFMKEFNKKNPLDKLNSFNDIRQMMEYTKNIVDQLLDYQSKYYDMYNKSFLTKNKFKKLLVEYNEKLRTVKKQIKQLEEENDLYKIKEEINDKNNYNDIKELLPLKENELDIFKELYGNYLDKPSDNKEENEKNKKLEEKKKNEEKTQNLLIKVLTHNVNKYGPINKIFTQTNSTEPERTNIRNLALKYNLPLNEEKEKEANKENKNESTENKKEEENEDDNNENKEEEKVNENTNNESLKQPNIFEGKITKWEYVSTEKPDKIDKKLEQYLKYFYSKRTFPKVIFKKTSTNNYEYGTQKVMIKIEGDTIRIRYVGGYLIIDKFIEMNAANEEKKLKKQSEKSNALPGNKKKDITSNKKK